MEEKDRLIMDVDGKQSAFFDLLKLWTMRGYFDYLLHRGVMIDQIEQTARNQIYFIFDPYTQERQTQTN